MTRIRQLLCFALLVCAVTARAGELPPAIADIEDPRSLAFLADNALQAGAIEDARMLFEAMLAREEVDKYLPYRDILKEALILERIGELEEAAAKYRESLPNDLLRTVQVLRILSIHPKRDELVEEAYATVHRLVDDAKAGEQNQTFYKTNSGKPRYLKQWTQEEFMAKQRDGRPHRR